MPGAYQLEPIYRTEFRNPPPTTPQEPQNLLRATLMNGLSGELEPIYRTDFHNPPPTTPQEPQNLLRATLMNGLGGRRNLSAGQFRGRLGKEISGTCEPCGMSGLGAAFDYKQAEEYYGMASQAPQWLADVQVEFSKLDLDPSQVDWGSIASQGMDTAINLLAAQLKVTPSGGEFIPPTPLEFGSQAGFERALAQATREYNLSAQQQAQVAVLALLKKQREKAKWGTIAANFSTVKKPGYPYVFKNATTGKLIWTTAEGKKVLQQDSNAIFVRREGPGGHLDTSTGSPSISPASSSRYVTLGILGAIGVSAAYFLFVR